MNAILVNKEIFTLLEIANTAAYTPVEKFKNRSKSILKINYNVNVIVVFVDQELSWIVIGSLTAIFTVKDTN